MARGNQKRGQCDVCANTKRIVVIGYRGRRLALCEACRLALSKLERAKQKQG